MKWKQKGWNHFRETSYAYNFALLTFIRKLVKLYLIHIICRTKTKQCCKDRYRYDWKGPLERCRKEYDTLGLLDGSFFRLTLSFMLILLKCLSDNSCWPSSLESPSALVKMRDSWGPFLPNCDMLLSFCGLSFIKHPLLILMHRCLRDYWFIIFL